MRRYLKNRCLEMLSVLEEAHDEITNFIENKRIDEAAELLRQCQEGAIGIGHIIENSEGEGTEEVGALERYCELVYQVFEAILQGGEVNTKQTDKKFKKFINLLSNGIKNRIPTQTEVLFLPYKASMWDSLESVWKKMDEDPDVSAIVIPIPYYDKNPDGSVREMHYEIDDFPSSVPVLDYRYYDIEARHPEAIYIHNPYADTLADKVLDNVLKFHYPDYDSYPYTARGSDERQYQAPGVDIPMVCFCRSKYHIYPEYHTSADNLDLISPEGLQGSFDVMVKCIEALEHNRKYRIKTLGEPQLGKRGLVPTMSSKETYQQTLALKDLIAYADGRNDLVDISNIIGHPVELLIPLVEQLIRAELF